jgi:hypothetical protein
MLMRRVSASLAGDRSLQWLPLVLVAVALGVMQARLLPVRYVPLDIPSTLGVAPGAAPEESIAPPLSAPVSTPSVVLPSESQPPAEAPSAELGSGAGAPGAQRVLPKAEGAAAVWSDRLPRAAGAEEGVGNLRIHARQPTAVSTLVASIVKSLNRIHPSAVLSAKALAERMAMLKPPPQPFARAMLLSTRAQPPKPHLTGWAVGGAAPQHNILGGPAFYAPRYAPVINGATFSFNRER